MKIKLIRAAFTPVAILVILILGTIELVRTPLDLIENRRLKGQQR
jgi:hypothetical protein